MNIQKGACICLRSMLLYATCIPTPCFTSPSRPQVLANRLSPLRCALVPPHARRIARLEALDCIRHLRPQPFLLEALYRVQICLEREEDGPCLGQPAQRLELDAGICLGGNGDFRSAIEYTYMRDIVFQFGQSQHTYLAHVYFFGCHRLVALVLVVSVVMEQIAVRLHRPLISPLVNHTRIQPRAPA